MQLDEYLYSIHDIDALIQRAASGNLGNDLRMEIPAGFPADYAEHVHSMCGLMTVGLQTDSTRVATFRMARPDCVRPARALRPTIHFLNSRIIEVQDVDVLPTFW